MLTRSPFFALRLLYLRLGYFFSRKLLFSLKDPHGYPIDSDRILISYWGMIVERDIRTPLWSREFQRMEAPVAIDAGANAGVFSHLLRILNPNVTIYAYEPLPDMATRLEKLQEQYASKGKVFAAAVGAVEGTATLFADRPDDTSASLLAEYGPADNGYTVDVVTLDSTAPGAEIDVLKVDTEHYELNVLRGATETLKRTRHLILEISREDEIGAIAELLGDAWDMTKITDGDYLFTRKTG